MQETRVRFLGWEDRLEESMATHSSVLAWRIPRIEALGGLQSMGPHTLIHSFIHSFSTFVEDLLYGKPCSSHWEYLYCKVEEYKQINVFKNSSSINFH